LEDSFSTEIDEPNLDLIAKVVPKVTEAVSKELMMKPYGPEKVKKTLFSIGDMKTLGVDGLHAIFFKNGGFSWVMWNFGSNQQ
jgi:hypothetical protein